MKEHLVETLVGTAVIFVAIIFLVFAYGQTEQTASGGFTLTAKIDNAAGVSVGTDVRIAGIKVGTVTNSFLDPLSYRAVLELTVVSDLELPEDSSMRVASEGLLGGNYVALQIGGDFDNLLGDGDELVHTQGSVDLIGLVQRAIFGATNGD